jgi:hypothetical protein
MEKQGKKTKFESEMEKAWEEARKRFLKKSGMKETDDAWELINETDNVFELFDVINETWSNRRQPVKRNAKERAPDPQLAGQSHPQIKFTDKLKRGFNKVVGRKNEGEVLKYPQAVSETHELSYVDQYLRVKDKVSGDRSTARIAGDFASNLIDKVETIVGSNEVQAFEGLDKTSEVIQAILNASEGLEAIVGATSIVSHLD